ncbi:MAG: class I SAM-dependent methyltransferase [Ruminococcaceae bacterium]|nr:class I SAM-dependent methyltransferase [Oscillospiraceae bacterium]
MKSDTLIKINKLFPPVSHPFNLQNEGVKSYCEWEFERGEDTLNDYIGNKIVPDVDTMLRGVNLLDVGAGEGGKSVYYLTRGVKSVTALDVIDSYKSKAEALAVRLGVKDNFTYTVADAVKMPFSDNSFDAVIMNDSIEHVNCPDAVLDEIYRVLVPHGRLYVNFPPYYHPYGAHLSDAIYMPWVHLFFDEQTLICAYKDLVCTLPDGKDRINFRISFNEDGTEYFSYINKMSIKRFNTICKKTKLRCIYYKEIPLRTSLSLLAKFPLTKEAFVKRIVAIFEKRC